MRIWLAIAAVLSLDAATGAQAQMKGLTASDIAGVARTRTLDLRLRQDFEINAPTPLMRGLIVQREVIPNGVVGIGLSNLYSKRKGTDLRLGQRPDRSHKPAVTFVLKF